MPVLPRVSFHGEEEKRSNIFLDTGKDVRTVQDRSVGRSRVRCVRTHVDKTTTAMFVDSLHQAADLNNVAINLVQTS